MALWACVHRIYESEVGDAYPVVEHVFYGRTRDEAVHYFHSHMKTDSFLRGCETKGRWDGVKCRTESFVTKIKV